MFLELIPMENNSDNISQVLCEWFLTSRVEIQWFIEYDYKIHFPFNVL